MIVQRIVDWVDKIAFHSRCSGCGQQIRHGTWSKEPAGGFVYKFSCPECGAVAWTESLSETQQYRGETA